MADKKPPKTVLKLIADAFARKHAKQARITKAEKKSRTAKQIKLRKGNIK